MNCSKHKGIKRKVECVECLRESRDFHEKISMRLLNLAGTAIESIQTHRTKLQVASYTIGRLIAQLDTLRHLGNHSPGCARRFHPMAECTCWIGDTELLVEQARAVRERL